MDTILTIILSCVGSSGLFSLISFLISRKDKKEDDLLALRNDTKAIKKALEALQQDDCRIQLQILLNHDPTNHDAILKVAERYFCKLHGNWYMDAIFQKWAISQKLDPTMFSKKKGE